MEKCRSLCIVTDAFPLEDYPINHFLEQLVYAFADLGIACDVIAPNCPLFLWIKGISYKPEAHSIRVTKHGNEVNVYSPSFISLMGRKRWGINLLSIYQKAHCRSAMRFLRKRNKEYDAFYAHFIQPSALTAVKLGSKYHKPVFFAYGDSSIDDILKIFSADTLRQRLQTVRGVIAVSDKNRRELIDNNIVVADKIGVFINAIDPTTFYIMDQNEARKELGIDPDDFVIAYVGQFSNRKGTRRVSPGDQSAGRGQEHLHRRR